jgi:hypothetical protein
MKLTRILNKNSKGIKILFLPFVFPRCEIELEMLQWLLTKERSPCILREQMDI